MATITLIWIISLLAIAGVIVRPFNIPEVIWAVSGALLLLVFGLISLTESIKGISKGSDVYLFLIGMMLLAETAREEKLFDWVAAYATKAAKGSSSKLFYLIYLAGIIVTTFLSNDATAVVLTPAVAAAAKAAKVKNPLPYLFICAFIANASSFILPISNPANLVIYESHVPGLTQWLSTFILPSVFSIIVTYLVLYLTQRRSLKQKIEDNIPVSAVPRGGKVAFGGIIFTALVLLVASAVNVQLGLPTAITGIMTACVVIIFGKKSPWKIIKGISWSILPLVAGLFVIVEGLDKTALTQTLRAVLVENAAHSINGTIWLTGIITAVGCNLTNNLPAGLIAGQVIQNGHVPELVRNSILIGIDLGPNFSITGSLATILWLVALRREGHTISAWAFLKLGILITTAALVAAISALLI